MYLCMTLATVLDINDLLSWLIEEQGNAAIPITLAGDAFNVITSLALFNCYLILDKPSVKADEQPTRDSGYVSYRTATIVLAVAVYGLSSADRFGLLGVTPPTPGPGVLLNCAFAGLAIMAVGGRLDSHHLGIWRPLIILIYLYGFIQIFYAGLPGRPVEMEGDGVPVSVLVAYALALVLKLNLYAVVYLLTYETNRLVRYIDASVTATETGAVHLADASVKVEGLPAASSRDGATANLLVDLFGFREMRRLPFQILESTAAQAVTSELPGGDTTVNEFAWSLTDALRRRGLLRQESTWKHLTKLREHQADVIRAVQKLWASSAPNGSVSDSPVQDNPYH